MSHILIGSLALLLLLVTPATAQVPDPTQCDVQVAAGTALITPLGSGDSLSSLGLTITVTIRDAFGIPIQGVANTRITLESLSAGLIFCPGDNHPLGATNLDGETIFAAPLVGGGFAQDLRVFVDGFEIPVPMALDVNGPDNTMDDQVNLSDLGNIASDIGSGVLTFRSDLLRDNLLDLADGVVFMEYYFEAGPCAPSAAEEGR